MQNSIKLLQKKATYSANRFLVSEKKSQTLTSQKQTQKYSLTQQVINLWLNHHSIGSKVLSCDLLVAHKMHLSSMPVK